MTLHSQLSFKLSYSFAQHSEVTDLILANGGEKGFLGHNFKFNTAYQLKIPETSMSFLPGLSLKYSNTDFSFADYRMISAGIEVPFKFFPFNMEGECNCPDFSVRNKFFEKHFFLLVNDGVFYNFYRSEFDDNVVSPVNNIQNFSFMLGAGMGIAIPFGKNIIISPSINYLHFFNDQWNSGYLFVGSQTTKTHHPEYEFEIRTMFFLR